MINTTEHDSIPIQKLCATNANIAVLLPVPGLPRKASEEEPQAETNEGVDSSNNP